MKVEKVSHAVATGAKEPAACAPSAPTPKKRRGLGFQPEGAGHGQDASATLTTEAQSTRRRESIINHQPSRIDHQSSIIDHQSSIINPTFTLNVLLAGKLTAMDAPGGGEVQMSALARALRREGVHARPWRPWEERLSGADCLHVFGSLPEHWSVVRAAHRQGVPVVLSTIAWFDLAGYWRGARSLARRLAAAARFLARAACPRIPSWRRRLYHAVDLVMPNSLAEARQLTRYFGVPADRIHVVPNGAEERFARADPEPFARLVGLRDFVLSAGRIEPRKNQLGLLRALRGTEIPIVVLGDVVPGHEAYGQACRRAADRAVRFVGRVDHDDPLLASAYAACACLALTSWFETPGLVALEAGLSGTPLVLPEGGCAREYFGPLASYVQPNDLRGIRKAVLAAVGRPRSPSLARHVRRNFTWAAAAGATRDGYQKAIRRARPSG